MLNNFPKIPHNRPCLLEDDEAAAIGVIRSNWIAQGAQVREFENEICRFLDLPEQNAVALSSGTAARFEFFGTVNIIRRPSPFASLDFSFLRAGSVAESRPRKLNEPKAETENQRVDDANRRRV